MSFVEAYRQNLVQQLNDFGYEKRLLVENTSLVLNPGFSRGTNVMVFAILKKEITGKKIACNLNRFLQFTLFEVFSRAFTPHIF